MAIQAAPPNRLASQWGAMNVGGVLPVQTNDQLRRQEEREQSARAEAANNEPVVQELASHIRTCWQKARDARNSVTDEMKQALRAKEGKYGPDMEQHLAKHGSSAIYMMLFATKARQAKALVADVINAGGTDKPWTVSPTPLPDLPEEVMAGVLKGTAQIVAEAEMSGVPMTISDISAMLRDARDKAMHALNEEARHRCDGLERRMSDLLLEGGLYPALDEFLDDMMVYKTAFLKGPVVRRRGTLKWRSTGTGVSEPVVEEELRPGWERVDPMAMFPSKGARSVQDGYLIEVHDLTAQALEEMVGVDGYSEDAIREVIREHEANSLPGWTHKDIDGYERPHGDAPEDTITALQFWGRVTGHALIDWGMGEEEVPDPSKSYEVEAWLVDRWVIKAVINVDPLAHRPYVTCSFERVPGRVWGTSLYDTMRDCEDMCNAAARALANNMGISSGPQVGVNVDRMPPGEDITAPYPWKIWQFGNDPTGSNAAPLSFFQPSSNANELMGVYDRFSMLADEYTGIPRYMAGLGGGEGGAGRTASGMSMMIGNANKTIKKLVAQLDVQVFTPMLEALHSYIMRFVDDSAAKGDVRIVARGALSMAVKEQAQVRRNEFLAATANPFDMQILGLEGRAALLREAAKALDMNPDIVVPPLSELKMRAAMMQQQQMQQMQQAQAQQAPGTPDQTQLMDGAPVTQQFESTPANM